MRLFFVQYVRGFYNVYGWDGGDGCIALMDIIP